MPSATDMTEEKVYFVYILRCSDQSLYTGITTDPERRFEEHRSRGKKCAKYTFSRPVECMQALWQAEDKAQASRLENLIKSMPKVRKLSLIEGNEALEGCVRIDVPEKCKEEIKINE